MQKVPVTFDPRNKVHLQAYYTLHYRGKLTGLRFRLEKPFLDVPSMMQHKIAGAFLEDNLKEFAISLRY